MYHCIIWHVSSMYPGGLAYRREHRIGDIPIIGISSIITNINNMTTTTTLTPPSLEETVGRRGLEGRREVFKRFGVY